MLIYKYHIFLLSGQVNPIWGNCQIIYVHRQLNSYFPGAV